MKIKALIIKTISSQIFTLCFMILISISILLKPSDTKAQHLGKIAVLRLTNKAGLSDSEVLYLSNQMQERVAQRTLGLYFVMTQENIMALLPSDQRLEDCLGAECDVEVGRLLGADFIMTAYVLKFGIDHALRCSMKIHETKTGTLLYSQTLRAKDVNHLESQLKLRVDLLVANALGFELDFEQKTENQIKQKSIQINTQQIKGKPIEQQNQKQLKDTPLLNTIDWISIKGGVFMMGNQEAAAGIDEKPVHLVKLEDFEISRTEVTVAQYRKCMEAGACSPPHWDDGTCRFWSPNGWLHGVAKASIKADQLPVVCVNWHQARAFAKWVGGDLPTEAQWEYAAKSGGINKKYPWGNQEPSCQYAVMNEHAFGCGNYQALPVCSLMDGNTEQGLCDMAGNVSEWILDERHSSYHGAPKDDRPWCREDDCQNSDGFRETRGSCWYGKAWEMENSRRKGRHEKEQYDFIGFRVAKRQ
jgi:sulfatase modifying factor 1